MWNYTEKVMEHFLHPHNVGLIEDADGVGEVGSLACGDALKLTFKLGNDGRIADAKFQTFGCASAIASSSVLTEMIKGLTIEEASKITNEDIVKQLDDLPKEKIHCSVMGQEALEKAIENYRGKVAGRSSLVAGEEKKEGEIICKCFSVTDKEIERAVRDHHLTTIEEVTNYTKAGGGCGGCHEKIQEIITRVVDESGPKSERPETAQMTIIQKIKKIEETLSKEIRPALQADGGDIELIDVQGNVVKVRLRGACSGCAMANATLKNYVESLIKTHVGSELVVEEA